MRPPRAIVVLAWSGVSYLLAWLSLAGFWLGLVPSPASASDPPPAAQSFSPPKPYTRVVHPNTNTVELQIALRRFQGPSPSSPALWLVAVSHIGETNYYQAFYGYMIGLAELERAVGRKMIKQTRKKVP